MSIPFTIGKLIDYFTSTHPVCLWHFSRLFAIIDVEREFDVANPFWIVSWTSFGYPSFFVYYRRISKRRPCYAYARLGPANCCAFAWTDIFRCYTSRSRICRTRGRRCSEQIERGLKRRWREVGIRFSKHCRHRMRVSYIMLFIPNIMEYNWFIS